MGEPNEESDVDKDVDDGTAVQQSDHKYIQVVLFAV